MTDEEFGSWQIWTAKVKFDDSSEYKVRPVVILRCEDGDPKIMVLKVTSKNKPYEYKIIKWRESGLDVESSIILKPFLIERRYIGRYIGTLNPKDIFNVIDLLRRKQSKHG